jgi:hypothetical protein
MALYALYWDDSAEDDPSYEKVHRAIYATQEEALAQAEADIEHGKRVLCIEQIEKVERKTMNRGEIVWEP